MALNTITTTGLGFIMDKYRMAQQQNQSNMGYPYPHFDPPIPGVSAVVKKTTILVIAVKHLPESIEVHGKDGASLTMTRDEFAAKLGIEW